MADKSGSGLSATAIALLNLFVSPQLFTTQTLHDYLWGYVDFMLAVCRKFDPELCKTDKIGLLSNVSHF